MTISLGDSSGTLPSGAATAAKQDTGNTSLATIVTNTTGILAAQGSTTSGQSGQLVQGAVTTNAPTYTTAQTNPMSLTTGGGLRIDLSSILGTALQVNNGVANSGVPRVVIGSSNSALPAWGHGATAATVPAGATLAGGQAITANPTAVTNGQLAGLTTDKLGRLVTTPVHARDLVAIQYTALAANTETTIVTAGAAGVFNDIIGFIISTAGAAAATLTIKDDTAGTTRMVLNYPDAALAPSGPLVIMFPVPLPQAVAAKPWTVTNSVSTATNITVLYAANK